MTILKTLPAELSGLIILVSTIATGLFFPEVSDFWLALAAAITLFLMMHVKTHMDVNTEANEKPSP